MEDQVVSNQDESLNKDLENTDAPKESLENSEALDTLYGGVPGEESEKQEVESPKETVSAYTLRDGTLSVLNTKLNELIALEQKSIPDTSYFSMARKEHTAKIEEAKSSVNDLLKVLGSLQV